MPEVYITCPETKKEIKARMSIPSPIDSNTFSNMRIECPACGKTHTFSNPDMHFEDGSR
jgi:hypothetical protein